MQTKAALLPAPSHDGDAPANPAAGRLAWIPPGVFAMGSPDTEPDRQGDEGPRTEVTISGGFWISKYETTQEEFLAVTGSNPSYFTGDPRRPVEKVSWDDAADYCAKLTQREIAAGRVPAGYEYRLPTEAEWEYACRAGTTTRFNYGDDPDYRRLGDHAWYALNSGGEPHRTGERQPNPWGLHDTHGNIWEWCLDWYGAYAGGSVTDPRGPVAGEGRVVRGGSWSNAGRGCRAADRDHAWPDSRGYLIGFRTVLARTP